MHAGLQPWAGSCHRDHGARFAVAPPTTDTTGTIEAFAMYAGTSVGGIDRIEPAAEVVERLTAGAERLLHARCP